MAVTYGFYNSKNGDRKYDAIQMSSIFDGIIQDGVFMHVSGQLLVSAQGDSMMVRVATGRAWFNHTWTLNDSILPITIPQSEVILNRIDAIVIDVNAEIRVNEIKVVLGTPSTNPVKPAMIKTNDHWQYPLAYIRVASQAKIIRQADITNAVGTSECPWVIAPLEKMDIDALVAQWGDQWKAFYEKQTSEMLETKNFWKEEWDSWFRSQTKEIQDAYLSWENQWETFYNSQTSEMTATSEYWKAQWEAWFSSYLAQGTTSIDSFIQKNQDEFDIWFGGIKDILDGDVAGNIANMLQDHEIRIQILEKFKKELSKEYTIWNELEGNGELGYSSLQDQSGRMILDSDGDNILGSDFGAFSLETQDNKPIESRVIFVTK